MSDKSEIVRKAAQAVTEKLSADGMVIEGGWRAFEIVVLQNASTIQRTEMRKAYFCGAQHLFASIMQVLDGGIEPTEKDLDRMDKIHKELERFTLELSPKG